MWNDIINLAIETGLWAVLFTGLLIFVINDSTKREQRYQQTIKDLTIHLGVVKEIKDDVDEIKEFVYKTKSKKTSTNNLKNNPNNFDNIEK